jgi:hypothetical protein
MMHLNSHPTVEINTKATHILFQQMGIVDTFRFLNQYTLGSGDYTKERVRPLPVDNEKLLFMLLTICF